MPNEQLSLCIIFYTTDRALHWIHYWLQVWGNQSPAENGFDAFWASKKNTSAGKSHKTINNFLLPSPLLLIRSIFCEVLGFTMCTSTKINNFSYFYDSPICCGPSQIQLLRGSGPLDPAGSTPMGTCRNFSKMSKTSSHDSHIFLPTHFTRSFLPHDALSAKHGIAMLSRPSVRQSATLMYREHIGWISSKLIKRIISVRSLHLRATTSAIYSKWDTPKFRWNRGGVTLLSRKPAISLKRGKIGPRLLLMTNRKLHMRFRFAPKLMTLHDLERPFAFLDPTMKIWLNVKFCFAPVFGALRPGFRGLATLKLVLNVVCEL